MKPLTINEVLADSLSKKNSWYPDRDNWIINPYIKIIQDTPLISIYYVISIERKELVTCDTGNFYDKNSGKCLGKSFKQAVYFMENEKMLEYPKLIPDVEWRPE